MREKTIEAKLVRMVKCAGGMAPKFVSPGLDGMPDRIVKYDVTHYKAVPVDYKETAQDRALIENGHYQISYGSDKIEEYDYSSISFTIDNVNYVLMTTSTLPEDEMFTLAEEYIDFINN